MKVTSESEVIFEKANNRLVMAGWSYLGADYWHDPITMTNSRSSAAHQVQKARDKFTAKQSKRK